MTRQQDPLYYNMLAFLSPRKMTKGAYLEEVFALPFPCRVPSGEVVYTVKDWPALCKRALRTVGEKRVVNNADRGADRVCMFCHTCAKRCEAQSQFFRRTTGMYI